MMLFSLYVVSVLATCFFFCKGVSCEPQAPALNFLYTAYVICKPTIFATQGPRGIREAIPIVGGNFTGPRLSGKILDLGADWGVIDVQTGIFTADTRYNLQTDDGANIFLRTFGPHSPDGSLHLHILFETGDKEYYWLNNVIGIGILHNLGNSPDNSTFTLRIDAWDLASDYNSTTFINGSSYA